jgi:alpha-galactosidase
VAGRFTVVDEVACDPRTARVYEHGWDSGSPAGLVSASRRTRFQGAGLLAVEAWPGGPARLWAAPRPAAEVPSIRACLLPGRRGARLVVRADGEVDAGDHPDLVRACTRWAEGVAALAGVAATPSLAPMWCARRGPDAEAGLAGDLEGLGRLGLPAGMVLVGGGAPPARAARLVAMVRRAGRAAGVRLAPFLAGPGLASHHPDWLVGGAVADGGARILDVTHPAAAAHLRARVAELAAAGADLLALDRLDVGARPGRRHGDASALAAYREGLRLVREAAGPGVVLLGRDAPLLPSVGLVDAMRVAPLVADPDGPALQRALRHARARGFQHARLWVGTPGRVLLRPGDRRRRRWVEHAVASGGLAAAGGDLAALDQAGVALLRVLLRPSSPRPVRWSPAG